MSTAHDRKIQSIEEDENIFAKAKQGA